jgi:hypothetical protein
MTCAPPFSSYTARNPASLTEGTRGNTTKARNFFRGAIGDRSGGPNKHNHHANLADGVGSRTLPRRKYGSGSGSLDPTNVQPALSPVRSNGSEVVQHLSSFHLSVARRCSPLLFLQLRVSRRPFHPILLPINHNHAAASTRSSEDGRQSLPQSSITSTA